MDNKLIIFRTVALTRSFSKAAKMLNITQPAVSKCVKNIEEKYERAFFERKANSIELTADGVLFLEYVEKIIQLYNALEDEFQEGDLLSGAIVLGASTTIANYILPKLTATIQKDYPDLKIDLIIANTLEIQQAILKKEINLGIVEGHNHNTRLHYEKFVKDELVLTSKYSQQPAETITPDDLSTMPVIAREIGSGTREVIENNLHKHQIPIPDYHSVMGSTESIKNYLLNSETCSFLSIHSIQQELKEGRLRIIDIEDLEITRWLYFIRRQGFQSKLTHKIQKLLFSTYKPQFD